MKRKKSKIKKVVEKNKIDKRKNKNYAKIRKKEKTSAGTKLIEVRKEGRKWGNKLKGK